MKMKRKVNHKEKGLFRGGEYCQKCQQKKSCGGLNKEKKYCCSCYCRNVLEVLEAEELLTERWKETLNAYRWKFIKCRCLKSKKPRVKYIVTDGSGWDCCEICEKVIKGAGHHRVIKNRNNPAFWGLTIPQRILCGDCLEKEKGKMPSVRKKEFVRYQKTGRFE